MQAGSSRYCDSPAALSIEQQDRLLRFSEVIKDELAKSGQRLAIISRSGLDLSRFNIRYSHAGFSLKASENTEWSVRQLYYACDEQRSRIFDQGMAGFVMGTDSPSLGYISVVLIPQIEAKPLETLLLQNEKVNALLHPTYSANSFAFSPIYQNCNQWVIEMLATSFGNLSLLNQAESPRKRAQQWLAENHYLPSLMQVKSRFLMLAGAFMSMIRNNDHPQADVEKMQYQVSMPAAIELFVRRRFDTAHRMEFCHNAEHIVIRQGWSLIGNGCSPTEGDTVIKF